VAREHTEPRAEGCEVTEPLRAREIACLHCGTPFSPVELGHRFCSSFCRHRGEVKPYERARVDREAVERLFDDRPDDERVRADDWFLGPPEFARLFRSAG
jgi:hypothetical protein